MTYLWVDGWAADMVNAVRARSASSLRVFVAVLLETLGGMIAAGIALIISLRAWNRRAARALAVFLVALAMFHSGVGLGRLLADLGLRSMPLESALSTVTLGIMCAALLRFSVLILDSTAPSSSRSLRAILYRQSLNSRLVWAVGGLAAVVMYAEGAVFGNALRPSLTEILIATFTLAAFSNLILASESACEQERRAIWWIWTGMLLASIGILLRVALGMLEDPLGVWARAGKFYVNSLGQIALLICLALAIFYRGALDPRLVIRRAALSGGIAAVLVFIFAVVENALTDTVARRVGIPEGIGGWIAGATAGFTFAPLHRAVKRMLDRHIGKYGDLPPPSSDGRKPARV